MVDSVDFTVAVFVLNVTQIKTENFAMFLMPSVMQTHTHETPTVDCPWSGGMKDTLDDGRHHI